MRAISYYLQYIAYRLLLGSLYLLPRRAGANCSGHILRLIAKRSKRDARAIKQVQHFFPELSAPQVRHIVDQSWQHAGKNAFELPFLKAFASDPQKLEISDPDNVLGNLLKTNGAMCVSAHFGNWELMAALSNHAQKPISCFYRPIKNTFLERHIRQQREAMLFEGEMLPARSQGVQKAIKRLRQGEIVGILCDVYENHGLKVPFLGVETPTNTIAANLALRCDVPIIAAIAYRRDDGSFKIYLEEIEKSNASDKDTRILETSSNINAFIEKHIRQEPSQWLWSLDRWKRTEIWNEEEKSTQLSSNFV